MSPALGCGTSESHETSGKSMKNDDIYEQWTVEYRWTANNGG